METTTTAGNAISIEKEEISNLAFPETEILQSETEIKHRKKTLENGMLLGNIEHRKIKIVFEDNESAKQVETTIWAVTENKILLKKGVAIPIHRIKAVNFY